MALCEWASNGPFITIKTWYFKKTYLIIIVQSCRVLFDSSKFFRDLRFVIRIYCFTLILITHSRMYIRNQGSPNNININYLLQIFFTWVWPIMLTLTNMGKSEKQINLLKLNETKILVLTRSNGQMIFFVKKIDQQMVDAKRALAWFISPSYLMVFQDRFDRRA